MWPYQLALLILLLSLRSKSWQQAEILDKEGDVVLYWTVDVKKNVLLVEVNVRTLGYVGLGISPTGTMVGADMMIGYVNSLGQAIVNARYMKPLWTTLGKLNILKRRYRLEFRADRDFISFI